MCSGLLNPALLLVTGIARCGLTLTQMITVHFIICDRVVRGTEALLQDVVDN